MLTEKQILEVRKLLDSAQNPLFFFDNDSDGLSSFLLMRRYLGRGKGVVIKSFPDLNEGYTRKITEFKPDYVIVLDKPLISEKFLLFLEENSIPLIWIDHHPPQEIKSNLIYYFNPLNSEKPTNEPTAYWCYKITNQKDDLWLGMIGCVGDWFIPDFISDFREKYPDLIEGIEKKHKAGDILYKTKIGKIANVLSFALKDRTSNVISMLKTLLKIKSAYELFEEDKMKNIYSRYNQINSKYSKLLEKAKELSKHSRKIFLFRYAGDLSISGELSNELFYLFPEKVIAVSYMKGNEAKISFRYSKNIRDKVVKIAEDLSGRGGGHEQAFAITVPASKLDELKEKLEKII